MTTPFDKLLNDNLSELPTLVSRMETLSQICEHLGYSSNGRYTKALGLFLRANDIDYSHFRTSRAHPKNIVECICPQCGKTFTKNLNHSKESTKVTCSHACGNKYFAEKQQFGRHKGNGWKAEGYVTVLNKYLSALNLPKECVVCGEKEVLDCHHIDEDRENNSPDNLVFLCPNHHAHLHRNNTQVVFESIVEHLDYRDRLKNSDLNESVE